jgi:DNA-binding beta-propeller fold protein YncE
MPRLLPLLIALLAALSFFAWKTVHREQSLGLGARDSSGPASGPTREIAFVSNVVDGSVTLLDPAGQQVVDTLDIIPDGRRVQLFRDPLQWLAQDLLQSRAGLNFAQDTDLSRDGTVLFVARGFLGDVAAFDIASGALLWRTPIAGFRADHMTLSPDGSRLYVSALIFGGNVVEILDSRSGERIGNIPAGQWPHDVHTSADGASLYVASLGNMLLELPQRGAATDAYRVTVADTASLAVKDNHDFDSGIRPFAITGDQARLYAQLSNAHAVIAYDLPSRRLINTLELPVAEGISEADWDFEAPHHGLALTPDESTLCLAGRASDYAALVATADLALQHLVPVGDAPSWAALADGGKLCLLPNTRSDDVSIVDIAAGRELARVPVGRAPKHVTVGRVPTALLD